MDVQIIAALIGAVATIIAATITVLFNPELSDTISSRIKGRKRLSWKSIEEGLTHILKEMQSDGFEPELIISVAGSGGIMANWLYKSRNRSIQKFVVLQEPSTNRWESAPAGHVSIQGNRWIIHIPNFLAKMASDKNVLILDSGYASGETAEAIKGYLENACPRSLKYACLVYVESVGVHPSKPDYYAMKLESSNFWYPWGKAS